MIYHSLVEETLECLLLEATNYKILLYLTNGAFVKAIEQKNKKSIGLRIGSDNVGIASQIAHFLPYIVHGGNFINSDKNRVVFPDSITKLCLPLPEFILTIYSRENRSEGFSSASGGVKVMVNNIVKMNKIFLIILFLLLLTLNANATDWRVLPIRTQAEYEAGLIGGEGLQIMHGVARCRNNPDVIYFSHDGGGVWKSVDAGETWEKPLSIGLYVKNGQSIAVDPDNADIVFIVVDQWWAIDKPQYEGVYKSTDGGDHWTHVLNINPGMFRRTQRAITYDPASASGERIWYVAAPSEGLFRSDDGGDSWSESLGLMNEDITDIYQVESHPSDGQSIYIATNYGLYTSDDRGVTIKTLGDLPEGNHITSVEVNPEDPNIIYATVQTDGLYKSTNAGTNFSRIYSHNSQYVFMNDGFPDTLYLPAVAASTVITHDAGQNWITSISTIDFLGNPMTRWGSKIGARTSGFAPNPDDPNECVVYSQSQIFKTADGGNVFQESGALFTGFFWKYPGGVVFDLDNPDRFATLNCDIGTMFTNSGGDYFEPRNNGVLDWYNQGLTMGQHTFTGAFQPIEGSQIMVVSVGGYNQNHQLMQTTDEGESWTLITERADREDHALVAFHPDDPTLVFSGGMVSTDSGENFTAIDFGEFNQYNPAVKAMSLSNPDTLYAVCNFNTRLIRSDDRGVNWYEVWITDWATVVKLWIIRIHPYDPNIIYTRSHTYTYQGKTLLGDIIKGTWDGSSMSWQRLGLLEEVFDSLVGTAPVEDAAFIPEVTNIEIDPSDPNIIYGGIGGWGANKGGLGGISNVWRTVDGGENWEDISYNLWRQTIAAMTIHPHSGELMVGTICGTWIYPPPYASALLLYNKAATTPTLPTNSPPVLDAIGNKSVDENVALIFDVNATDPNGEPITYSAQGLPSGATLDPQTGDFAWTPSYQQASSYQVTFRASDGNSWDSETITITVNNVNRPPVLGAITDQSVNENGILSLSVNASDPDGQALTYSVSGLPAGAVFVSQTLTWTPSYDQAGTFPVTFTADDGQAQDSQPITITVINVNRTPVLAAINNQSVWADDPLTFTIDATDPDGDAVTYSVGTLPSGATFTSQDFDWTPSQGQMGSYDVTFIASDGQLQDSQTVTITVDVDSLAPTITNLSPTAGSIQVPLNNLITLNVTDAGKGVNANSVKIKVKINSNPNNDTVYFGDMDHYISLLGDCRRIGSNADYKFVFQPTQDLFYYDQTVTITVNATDLAGNIMDEYSYSFATEMHSFGQNKQVNSGSGNNDRPVTVCDSSGNIWTAWHAGPIGNRDIYIGKLATGADDFGSTVQLTDDATDQCKPAVALDSSDKLYVVWQDNREGDWDIYISTSVDGISWSTEIRVNDPNNGNQVNPAIVIDGQSPNQAHVVWQDDRAGNQDICIATSSDGFATKTVSQITTDSFDQVEPAVAADADNTIYVVWTDGRNGSNDIYGAASNNPWTNVAIVSNANNQSSPTIAAESVGAILHLLWVDDTLGDKDIYYASSDGLPGSPLTGSSIIDDSSGADQLEPAIAVTGSTGNNLKVFACWQDWRNTDTDLYFAELSSSSGTNVFVGDGGSSTYQGEPVIGIDEYSHPYLIWADNRSTNTEIYYAGSTFVEPVALASELVAASAPSSTTVGADPQAITTIDDVSIVVPVGACSFDVAITVTKIANPQTFAAPCLGGYDFGPSGIQFSQPVTITIPYVFAGSDISATPYWFNALSGNLSQQGITDVQDIVISPTLHALSFKTTHFTAFYLLGGGAAAVLGGGGGGGCSVSAGGKGNMVEFALPYIGLVVVMAILKVRDARERKARST